MHFRFGFFSLLGVGFGRYVWVGLFGFVGVLPTLGVFFKKKKKFVR